MNIINLTYFNIITLLASVQFWMWSVSVTGPMSVIGPLPKPYHTPYTTIFHLNHSYYKQRERESSVGFRFDIWSICVYGSKLLVIIK